MTTGTVVTVDRQNHLSISVRYSVEGRFIEQTYEGSEKSVGEAVYVYYSPKDATVSDIFETQPTRYETICSSC